MNVKLLRKLRELRYRTLDHLVGSTVVVARLESLQDDLMKGLATVKRQAVP